MGSKSGGKLVITNLFRYNRFLLPLYLITKKIHLFFTNTRYSDEKYIKRMFKKYQGYDLDLTAPKSLNEKLQWLKIHDRRDFHQTNADKFAVREYLGNTFGGEYLIPLVFSTTDYKELKPENLPEYPVVIKTNHGFGNSVIVRDKNIIDWNRLRIDYKIWLKNNYYFFEREWQYKEIKPRIIVEKMLLNRNGHLPNDYKLNFIEGKLQFIYVSVDREGTNKRNIYDADWKPMYFTWARSGKDLSNIRGEEISPPSTLSKMIGFGTEIARQYRYVRVDFYDVDGRLYFGEITQCHGGGFDRMVPFEYDLAFGAKMHQL